MILKRNPQLVPQNEWDASAKRFQHCRDFFFKKLNADASLYGFIDFTRFCRGLPRQGISHLNMGSERLFRDVQATLNWNGRPELLGTVVGLLDTLAYHQDALAREQLDLSDCPRTSDIAYVEKAAKASGLELFRLNRVKLGPDVASEHKVFAMDDVSSLEDATQHIITELESAHPRCSCACARHTGRSCKHYWACHYAIKWQLGQLAQDLEPFAGEELRQRTADAVITRAAALASASGDMDFPASGVNDRRDPVKPCPDDVVPRTADQHPTYSVTWPAGTDNDGSAFDEHTTWEPRANVPWSIVKKRYPADRHYFFKRARDDCSGRGGADSKGRVGRRPARAQRPRSLGQQKKKRRRSQKKHAITEDD
jgi:hypothetical protein